MLHTNSFPPIMLPEPEVLIQYGKLAMRCLHALRRRAKEKGRGHRKLLDKKAAMNV